MPAGAIIKPTFLMRFQISSIQKDEHVVFVERRAKVGDREKRRPNWGVGPSSLLTGEERLGCCMGLQSLFSGLHQHIRHSGLTSRFVESWNEMNCLASLFESPGLLLWREGPHSYHNGTCHSFLWSTVCKPNLDLSTKGWLLPSGWSSLLSPCTYPTGD